MTEREELIKRFSEYRWNISDVSLATDMLTLARTLQAENKAKDAALEVAHKIICAFSQHTHGDVSEGYTTCVTYMSPKFKCDCGLRRCMDEFDKALEKGKS